jgi:hypothetical protein
VVVVVGFVPPLLFVVEAKRSYQLIGLVCSSSVIFSQLNRVHFEPLK